jgi:formylglycine-generating enzyme required for sulfatase activity/type II secretory pathway pseudopilin PulG
VIAIIAILAVVVILTLNPAQMLAQARDSNRLSDLSTLNSAINLYNTDQSGVSTYSLGLSSTTYLSIPDPTASTTCGGLGGNFASGGQFTCGTATSTRAINGTGWMPINFSNISAGSPLGNLPVDPVNTTSSNEYYSYQTNGNTFRLVANPESQKYAAAAGANPLMFVSGSNTILDGGNWVPVPGNSTFGTNDFYVMKYDATCSDGNGNNVNTPVDAPNGYDNGGNSVNPSNCTRANSRQISSLPGGLPIVDISQTQAISYCASIGAHLITNNEWQTIAWTAESQASNWTGGVVGTGGLYIGNANNASEYPADPSDANGYAGETNKTIAYTNDERRTLSLSNGAIVWDMAGNVWQWTSDTIQDQNQPTGSAPGFAWRQFTAITTWGTMTQQTAGPMNSAWSSTQDIGAIYSDGTSGNTTPYGFVRGGNWGNGGNVGVETLNLLNTPGSTYYGLGFRCAR